MAEDPPASRSEHLPLHVKVGFGSFHFEIDAGTVELAEELIGVGRYAAKAVIALGAVYLIPRCRPIIRDAIVSALGGVRQYAQAIGQIWSGSLHFVLRCFTDDRFLEILRDYEAGKIKKRLEEEFLKVGIRTTGLEVKIKNIEEVEETNAAINERYRNLY